MSDRPTDFYVEVTNAAELARLKDRYRDTHGDEVEPDWAREVHDFTTLAEAMAFYNGWEDPGFGAVVYRRNDIRDGSPGLPGGPWWEWDDEALT